LTDRPVCAGIWSKRVGAVVAIVFALLAGSFVTSVEPAQAERAPSCIHTNTFAGPFLAAELVAYNRCDYNRWGSSIPAKPVFAQQPDGACKRMIRNHRYTWPYWGVWNFVEMRLCNP
jgi:hypothetical protein